MPQLFQVLRCYKCSVFQVHQTKKSNKWQCKLCGEKQSIKRHYGVGTGKECRLHVQKLNGTRGELNELNESAELNKSIDDELENFKKDVVLEKRKICSESKWATFTDKEDNLQKPEVEESMYLGNREVVLEMPIRKRKKFKPPTNLLDGEVYKHDVNNYDDLPNCELHKSLLSQETTSNQEQSISHNNPFFKINHTQTFAPQQKNEKPSNFTNEEIQKNNSKWAEFVEEPEDLSISGENTLENVLTSQENTENESLYKFSSKKINVNLFAQCDESELDDVLQL